MLANRPGEDWRDPEAPQRDGGHDENGEVRHRHTRGRREGVAVGPAAHILRSQEDEPGADNRTRLGHSQPLSPLMIYLVGN